MRVVGNAADVERPSMILIQLRERLRAAYCGRRGQRGVAVGRSGEQREGRRSMVNARRMVQSRALGVLRALAGVLALFVALLPLRAGRARGRRRGPAAAGRARRGRGRRAPARAAGSAGGVVADRHQLPGHLGRQPLGRRRRSRRSRLRRRPVPPRRRHQRARLAPRRSPARAVRRPGPGDRPPARSATATRSRPSTRRTPRSS